MQNTQIEEQKDREERLKEFFTAVAFLGIYEDVPNEEAIRVAVQRSRTVIGALYWTRRLFTMDTTPPSRETIAKIAYAEGLLPSSLAKAA